MYKTIFFNAEELKDELVCLGVDYIWAQAYAEGFVHDYPILLSSEIQVEVIKEDFLYVSDDYKIDLNYTSVQF